MIYEQRVVKGIPGKEEEFIGRARKWLSIAKKCGARVTTGIFQTIIGDTNEFSYILEYDDLLPFEGLPDHRLPPLYDIIPGLVSGGQVNSEGTPREESTHTKD